MTIHNFDKHYIDGRWVASSGDTIHTILNPATEVPVTKLRLGTAGDVDKAVVAARKAFASYSETTKAERLALLERIREQFITRMADIGRSLAEEMGAPISMASTTQAESGVGHLDAAIAALRAFEFSEQVGESRVDYEPIGVVALITPWNWPINQAMAKIAPALAAGNTIVFKPSEQTPGSANILAEILEQAGVPAGVFNMVHGNGADVGNAMSAHPDIDMISFTGSTRAGIQVARNAADTVKRVHQELGGKSPYIVLPGTPLKAALTGGAQAFLLNSGQSCIAPTRFLVHADQYDEAVSLLAGLFANTRVDDPLKEGEHLGPVVNLSQYEKIQALIETGIREGAHVAAGGPGRVEGKQRGYFVKPTLLSHVTNDMTVAQEEIFGPVLVVISYRDLDEAVTIANDTPYGLGAFIAGDPAVAAPLIRRLRAGTVFVNAGALDFNVPFGGYKKSGNGREYGKFGIEEFLEKKAVVGAA